MNKIKQNKKCILSYWKVVVLTARTEKITIFWDVVTYRLRNVQICWAVNPLSTLPGSHLPSRWRQYVLPKRRYVFVRLMTSHPRKR